MDSYAKEVMMINPTGVPSVSIRPVPVLAALALSVATVTGALAQSPAYELSGGGISQEQIDRGETAFMTNCAGCHGDDLRSIDSNAPDLRGPTFQYGWANAPLSEKFEKITATMPPGMGGALDDQTYADIVAFILATNGVEPSDQELPGDAEALEAYVVTQP
jgi:mono/diheme cytochrome c family protein